MRALDDILILDLSRVLAGPWSTQILGDLGATVIKVEKPGEGDDTRRWGPPFLTHPETGERGDPPYYLAANRNKRSVTIDMTTPEGQEMIKELASKADVLVENYKVGGLKKYGLDYASLSQINPRLVYCSITGFGQDGPYAPRAGYDFIIQGMGGMMSVTGERDDLPGGGPQKTGVAWADLTTALYSAIGILGALNQRHRSGRGQHLDIALLDVQVATLANQALHYLVSGDVPQRMGNGHSVIVPYQSFKTSDGYVIIAVGNDGQFAKLADYLGHPEWSQDERFKTNPARNVHRNLIVGLIEEETKKRTLAEMLAALEQRSIPGGPINDIKMVFEDEQVKARKLARETSHAWKGTVPAVASPLRLSDSPVTYDRGPPLLGQHTEEILREFLKMDDATLESYRQRGIV